MAIVLPVVLAAALEWAPKNAVVFAVFGVIASLSLADFGGPPLRRAGAYASLAAFGLINVVLGSWGSHQLWLGVLGALVVGTVARLIGVFGGYWGMGTFSALLAYVLSVSTELPSGALLDRLGGWAAGCAVAAVAALTLWPRRERRDYRRLVATATGTVAEALRARLPDAAPADTAEVTARARADVDAARKWLLTTPYRPAGPASADQVMVELTMLVGRISHAATQLRPLGDDPVGAAALVRANATLLEHVRDRLEGDDTALLAATCTLSEEHEALHARVEAWVEAGMNGADDTGIADTGLTDAGLTDTGLAGADGVLDQAFRALSCARITGELAWCTEETVGGDPTSIATVIDRTPSPTHWSTAALGILRSHLTLRSSWFRQCLRTGVGLALAVGIAMASDLQHGFWVVLGTMSVLRTSARATTTTALRVVVGTAIGFALAVVVIESSRGSNLALWVLLPLVSGGAVYAAGVLDDIWGQAGFTLMVVMVFDLIASGGWEVGLVRVETVAIGAAVSVVVCALMWPGGAATIVRSDVAEYFRTTGRLLSGVIVAFAEGRAEAPDGLERACQDAHQRALQAYGEYLGESPEHLERWGVWARLLFVPSYAAFAARHVEHTYLHEGQQVRAPVAAPLAAHAQQLGDQMVAAGDRIRTGSRAATSSGADASDPDAPGVQDTADVAATVTPSAAAELRADLLAAKGSPAKAQVAVTQAWVDCWMRDLDAVIAGLEEPLSSLRPPVRSRWWAWHRAPDAPQPAR